VTTNGHEWSLIFEAGRQSLQEGTEGTEVFLNGRERRRRGGGDGERVVIIFFKYNKL
jgi:hypothetical protein